jgi:hypothetical protein
MLYRIHLAWVGFELTTLVVIGTDCTCSCKSNYHTIRSRPRRPRLSNNNTKYFQSSKRLAPFETEINLYNIEYIVNSWKVWRYQREVIRIRISKKNRQHWPKKDKVQKDKQRSTKHTYKTKDRVTRTPLKTGGELNIHTNASLSSSKI